MHRSLTSAAVLAGMSLAACGAGNADRTAAGSVDDPCTLTTRDDASRAFGVRAPKATRRATYCEYNLGRHQITVEASRGHHDPKDPLGPQQRRVSGPGYTGLARTLIPSNLGTGAQAGVAIYRGQILVSIVITDTQKQSGDLLGTVVGLGRSAAAHLAAGKQ